MIVKNLEEGGMIHNGFACGNILAHRTLEPVESYISFRLKIGKQRELIIIWAVPIGNFLARHWGPAAIPPSRFRCRIVNTSIPPGFP